MHVRENSIKFKGRIIYLTEDATELRHQLDGRDFEYDPERKLLDNISTDEITPGWVCYYYDETLARYLNVGLRHNNVEKDDFKSAGAAVLVSGLSKGCGSSRETAPYSEKWAGVQLILAKNIEKIYGQNCQNIGLLTSTDFGLIERINNGESIPLSEFTEGLDPISADIVRFGGLFPYNKARLAGDVSPPLPNTAERPMNITEKIIAASAVANATTGELGVPSVKPGDAVFCNTDVRFTHEYVTPMAESLFKSFLGSDAKVRNADSVFAFRDHLTFLKNVMSPERKKMGLLAQADGMAVTQKSFAKEQGIRLFGEVEGGGSEAICHNAVLEEIGCPGNLIVGSDSHTCTAGALGAFAFGVGATDIANSWYTKDIRVLVPEVVRIELTGDMPDGCCAKDLMLRILATPYIREGNSIGKVLEFGGEGVNALNMDERATLTNMAVEGGATTGIIEADEVTVEYLKEQGRWDESWRESRFFRSDPDAEYAHRFEIDLVTLTPMVATPGDPRNGVELQQLLSGNSKRIPINIAYGGSCTGGKKTDMDMYAEVLAYALEKGLQVQSDVDLYIQFGSQQIKQYAAAMGYLDLFERAGAKTINPSCGACINAGPGVSDNSDQVTVSAINRNFPGRSGPGQVYLASPIVVAASAVMGYISGPQEFEKLVP
ncbi:MAG TPA: 3-isopropylmalate dehydratase [Myxococcales bacterium]|nr:3-isopropylmalate dehydratase [Myxococcales bacterium]